MWNQGLVASESFLEDKVFRAKFRQEAKKRPIKAGKDGFDKILPKGNQTPNARDYTVIFGVMRHVYKATCELGLPFFSKVSLRVAAERIKRMGYKVELQLIRKN